MECFVKFFQEATAMTTKADLFVFILFVSAI